jgi:5-methylcytosine-specific restriction protein B
MNTADRSIALIDTALRRRFDFIEMMPQADVLRNLHADKVDDLDVAAMLETINKRIEYLFDREHTIGHAFFTSLKDDPSLEKLSAIFKKNIIPLLQEYFYEDYGKIQLILGDSGKSEEEYKFIKDNNIDKDLFKGNPEIDIDDLKYEINDKAFCSLESYKQIR